MLCTTLPICHIVALRNERVVAFMALTGVTVVAIEQAVAAPFATRQLADLGARVIKVERVDGGDFARAYDTSVAGQSSYFVWLNSGKESLAVDLKHPQGLALVKRLVAGADVFVQNLAPSAASRLGLGSDDLRAQNDRLITCDISGYGDTGPWAGKKAYDLLVQCETGLVSITGTPQTPAKVGISIADISAGMYAFSGILTALLARERTGHGSAVKVSLLESLAEWMGAPAIMAAGSGRAPVPHGLAHATIAPYGPFPARDGTVVIAIQNEREFLRFVDEVLHLPDLAQDPRFASNSDRVAHRVALDQQIGVVTSTLGADELTARLDAVGIANGRVRGVEGLLDHPQVAQTQMWRTVDSPAGPVQVLTGGATISGVARSARAIPALGQHTSAILAELGVLEHEIDQLLRDAVVGAPMQIPGGR
jgi:itaconate CoA-transferase